MSFAENYLRYKNEVEPKATLIAISKGQSVEAIMQVYEAGCRDFGESRVQEALDKMEVCPKDIRWHLIGTLQTKKVPKIIGRFYLIHSVDNPDLAKKINQCSVVENVHTNILLQVNVSGELTKHGLSIDNWRKAFDEINVLPNISVLGLMTMAPHTDDHRVIKHTFFNLNQLKHDIFKDKEGIQLSMGMTDDYKIALEQGSTLVRVGSGIFC